MSFKIGVLKNFANFIGKGLCRSLFLIKSQSLDPATLLKRDSNTSDFLWNLRAPPVAASEERIAKERNFPCLYDKGNRAAKKKIRKRTPDLGWRMPAATTKLLRQFRLVEKMYWKIFIMALSRKTSVY